MIHHVFANRSNAGDWLSAKAIQSLLRSPVEEHLCDEPFVPETLRRLSAAGPDDLVIIGGGGLFMDYFTPFWEGFSSIAPKARFAIWGAGYCDLKHEETRIAPTLIREVAARAKVCAVRDELTQRHLQTPNTEVAPCPSMLAVPNPKESGWGILHSVNFTTAGSQAYEAMQKFAKDFAQETDRPFRETNNRIEAGSQSDLENCLQLYEDADVVLSSRLHGCILAVTKGRRLVAVSGDRKIESFMEAACLSD